MKNVALIVAGGQGARLSGDIPKQYIKLKGISILRRTILKFLNHPKIDQVKVVINKEHLELYNHAVAGLDLLPPTWGGASRQQSVVHGLNDLKAFSPKNVLIHDAARPFIDEKVIYEVIEKLASYKAVDVGVALTDTIKSKTPLEVKVRDDYFLTHTPQGFDFQTILALHKQYNSEQMPDDISLCLKAKIEVGFVNSNKNNIKITLPEDLKYAEFLMESNYMIRVGYGFDIHKFIPMDATLHEIMLCGIAVPHNKSFSAHSDGDVALHAITDALLGALGEEDIGMFFPPTDPKWKGADSTIFLKHAHKLLLERGGSINNVDVTIVTESPKLMNYKKLMRKKIAELLVISDNQVSIKAKTSEKLGFVGRGEGISTSAVCTITLPHNFEE